MAGLRRFAPAAALAAAVLCLVGCGSKEPTSADVKVPDPYAGMTGQQKVDAIRNDPKINTMEKSQRIMDAQKEAGLPVTGQ